MSVLVVGSVAYDSVETPKGSVEKALGGSAVFFSSAASIFTGVNVVGVVGEDFDFKELEFLKRRGVDYSGVVQKPGSTFSWKGVYGEDPNERETVFTRLGVFAQFNPVIPKNYKNSDFVFLANIDPELQLEVLSQVSRPKLVALDTMNFWIQSKYESLLKVLGQSDIFILNDAEARLLTGTSDLYKAGKQLFALGPHYIVIKKGEHGAILLSEGEKFITSIFPLEEVVDPTGAGDTFAGGFMGYIGSSGSYGWEVLKLAMVYGAACASFAVEDFSVNKLKAITMREVEDRVAEIRKITQF